MNMKYFRKVAERTKTLSSLIRSCEKGISLGEGELAGRVFSELSEIYKIVNSAKGIESMHSGIPSPHSDEIKSRVRNFVDARKKLSSVLEERAEKAASAFEDEYKRLLSQEAVEKSDLGALDRQAGEYSGLQEVLGVGQGGFFWFFSKKDTIIGYKKAREDLDKLDEKIMGVKEKYMSADMARKKQFQGVLSRLQRLSSRKAKITSKDPLLAKVYSGDEAKAIEDLQHILANFKAYMKEEESIRQSNNKMRQTAEMLRKLSGTTDPATTLKELGGIERKERAIYSSSKVARFRALQEENSALLEETRDLARARMGEIIGRVLQNVNESYRFAENALVKELGSEGYETLITRAGQRLKTAKSDLDMVCPYRKVRQEKDRYSELSSAVSARIEELRQYRNEKANGAKLEEKALDVEAGKIELERMKLEKRERIRSMELRAAEAHGHASGPDENHVDYERCYKPRRVRQKQDPNFSPIYSSMKKLEDPENMLLKRPAEIIREKIGKWTEMLNSFRECVDGLPVAESERDKKYAAGLRGALKRSMDNGTLTYYMEIRPEVKEAAEKALDSLDNYIARFSSLETVNA